MVPVARPILTTEVVNDPVDAARAARLTAFPCRVTDEGLALNAADELPTKNAVKDVPSAPTEMVGLEICVTPL